mmetsp:Transcript_52691/g.155276  ORF Transcript_52691/g.155276 Transcript_52691/m.155276 type:complete len:208 (-) Transcript_52691:37-660(-)
MEGGPADRAGQAAGQGGDAPHPRRPQQGRMERAPHVHRVRGPMGGCRLRSLHCGPPADVTLRDPGGGVLRRFRPRVHEEGGVARHVQGCRREREAQRRRAGGAARRAVRGSGARRSSGRAGRAEAAPRRGLAAPAADPGDAQPPAAPAPAPERALAALGLLRLVVHGGGHADLAGAGAAPREARGVAWRLLHQQPLVLHGGAARLLS